VRVGVTDKLIGMTDRLVCDQVFNGQVFKFLAGETICMSSGIIALQNFSIFLANKKNYITTMHGHEFVDFQGFLGGRQFKLGSSGLKSGNEDTKSDSHH